MVKAKKRFGQHFLNNEEIAESIAMAVVAPSGKILEVGPGQGVLTKYLLGRKEQLRIVELDKDLIPILEKTFEGFAPNIIQGDFLKMELDDVYGEESFSIVGNFPYNISTQILFKAIEWREYVPELVGMFQKEVAKRVVSPPGSKVYGVTSVLIQAYFDCEYLFSVGPENFLPPPKVQSGVIRLTRKKNYELPCDEVTFKRLVKMSFGQRRKMLRNTLRGEFPPEELQADFFRKRPEELSVEDFIHITKLKNEAK